MPKPKTDSKVMRTAVTWNLESYFQLSTWKTHSKIMISDITADESTNVVVFDPELMYHCVNFVPLSNLILIDISKSRVSSLSDSIGKCSSLQILKANKNLLTALPESLGQLKYLRELQLAENKLCTLPLDFSGLISLEILNVSFNQFHSPPSCLEIGCLQLTHLDLSYNHLREWPWIPMCVYALRVLNLSHNCLRLNPAWLWTNMCLSLEKLDLSFNYIGDVAYEIDCSSLWHTGVTVTLQCLNLANCGVSSSNLKLIQHLKFLKKLNIGNKDEFSGGKTHAFTMYSRNRNVIWKLPMKSFQFRLSVIELFIPDLGLCFLPDDMGHSLEVLEILDCQNNRLNWLPASFSSLSKLKVAVFSYNELFCLPEDFGELKSLEELWLDNNKIDSLPSSFSKLQNLHWLDLYGNNLQLYPPELKEFTNSLNGLDLGFNAFDVHAETKKIPVLSYVYGNLEMALRVYPQLGIIRNLDYRDNIYQKRTSGDMCFDVEIMSDHSSEGSSNETATNSIEEKQPGKNNLFTCDEEIWEENEDEFNDSFDPTISGSSSSLNQDSPLYAMLILGSIEDPNSFCPYDIHPSPAPRASKKCTDPYFGQFEDA